MMNIATSFRVAINSDLETIITVIKENYKSVIDISVHNNSFILNGNTVVITYNEDYNYKLSLDQDDGFMYYENNMDFYPFDDAVGLETQIRLAKEITYYFSMQGIRAEVIAEFENML